MNLQGSLFEDKRICIFITGFLHFVSLHMTKFAVSLSVIINHPLRETYSFLWVEHIGSGEEIFNEHSCLLNTG